MRAWGVRPNPDGAHRMEEFLNHGLVAIGYCNIGDLDGLSRGEIKDRLRTRYGWESERSIGQHAGDIVRLVQEIEEGDYVLVPDGPVVFFGRVAGPYQYDETVDVSGPGYPHQRPVEWLHGGNGIPRSLLPGSLYNSLKSQNSVFGVDSELAEDMAEKGPLFKEQQMGQLKDEYREKLQSHTLPGVYPSSFEDVVKIVLRTQVPLLQRTATTSDPEGDTDLKAELPGGVAFRVQVKHFTDEQGRLGSKPVNQLAKSMDPGDVGLVVTSGSVGEKAARRSDELFEVESKVVEFINGEDLVEMIFANLEEFDDEELEALGLLREYRVL